MSHFTFFQYQLLKKTTGAWECSIKILSYEVCFNSCRVQQNIPLNCCKYKRFEKNMYLRTKISEAICQNSSVACYGVWTELKCIWILCYFQNPVSCRMGINKGVKSHTSLKKINKHCSGFGKLLFLKLTKYIRHKENPCHWAIHYTLSQIIRQQIGNVRRLIQLQRAIILKLVCSHAVLKNKLRHHLAIIHQDLWCIYPLLLYAHNSHENL